MNEELSFKDFIEIMEKNSSVFHAFLCVFKATYFSQYFAG